MTEPVPTYHERVPELQAQLAERGNLGLVIMDASSLGIVESTYGSEAYEEVRQRLFKLLREQRGKDFRGGDILALDEPRGLRLLIFLERKRRKNLSLSLTDLRAVWTRLLTSLAPNVARTAFPYLKTPPRIDLGYAIALYNPLVGTDRIVSQAFRSALDQAGHHRKTEEIQVRERLQDLIVRERVVTAYQPILLMKDRTVLGFEALSRGARGTGLETADGLFGAAEEHGLMVELDRLCRARALLSSGRVPSNARLFVNTLPATIRDPQFRGRPLIEFLDRAQVSPDRIVIEITEKLVIENYGLFRETMAYFTDLGMSFAVDDVGAGYSGLEAIARLKPHFLKIDTSLIRDVHSSVVNREMVKAIISLGHGIGATVIAEGIQTEEECRALQSMGVDYGQGFYLARPDPGPE
ncbi:MAG: EAL domain-containing protein [Acidobacteria bacterium]|nr:EAL domain-containing protein [Acidobacteriota bacterium]